MTDTDDARLHEVLATGSLGTLATIKRDGRPQLSDVTYGYDRERSRIRISVTAGRAKTANARRDPRVSLIARNEDGWGYAVAEGTAHLGEVAGAIDDDAVAALVELYQDLRGEHPDWDEYRQAMVDQRRQVLTIEVGRVYGAV